MESNNWENLTLHYHGSQQYDPLYDNLGHRGVPQHVFTIPRATTSSLNFSQAMIRLNIIKFYILGYKWPKQQKNQAKPKVTVFPCLSTGSQMSGWSRMSAGSKVYVFQMSAKNESKKR